MFVLVVGLSSYAQDSIREKNEWKFLIGFDARTSRVLGERSGIGGLKIGATLNKKHKMGMGFYFLKRDIVRPGVNLPLKEYPTATDTTAYKFGYTSFFYEPVWYRSKRLELSTPFHLGGGNLQAFYVDTLGQRNKYFDGGAPLFEISGVGQYKIFRWFAIGVGAGYRSILIRDKQAQRALNGAVGIFQVKVLFGVLYKLALKKPIEDGWDD